MIQIVLLNSQVRIETENATGNKVLTAFDPQAGIAVSLPIPSEVERQLGLALASSVAIANGPLVDPRAIKQ